jgi:peptidoglycan/LPS O-acetylase OafA/YrhL
LSQQKIHFKQLDGLRCVAVLAVLFSHWIHFKVLDSLPLGPWGVNLFFVLSGFLIARILLLSKEEHSGGSIFPPIKHFYLRRFLRIFPIYYLTVIFLIGFNFSHVKEYLGWLLTYTFNIKIALPSFHDWDPIAYILHLWSLSVEEQFYILIPLLIFLIPKAKIKYFFYIIILTGLLSRVFLHFISAPVVTIYFLTPSCFDAFGFGALLAYYLLYEQDALTALLKKTYLFYIAVLLFIINLTYSNIKGYGSSYTVFDRFLFSAACFWLVGKAALGTYKGVSKRFLEHRAIRYIGKISYGIYIYHPFVFPFIAFYLEPVLINHLHISKTYLLDPAFEHNNMVGTALLLFIITLSIASLSWYLIESPINKLKEKINY